MYTIKVGGGGLGYKVKSVFSVLLKMSVLCSLIIMNCKVLSQYLKNWQIEEILYTGGSDEDPCWTTKAEITCLYCA